MKRPASYLYDEVPNGSFPRDIVDPDVWWNAYNREYRRLFYAAYGVGGVCPTRPRVLAVPLTELADGAAQARVDFSAHASRRVCENAGIDLYSLHELELDAELYRDYYSRHEVDPRAWYAAYCAEYQRLWYTVHGVDTCCPNMERSMRIARTNNRDGAVQARADFEARFKQFSA